MKHTSWGNSRICVAELQLPWVINIQPSGYVVGPIGCWACSEAGCCRGNGLELNPAWSLCIVSSFLCALRGGGCRFSHAPTHTVYVCLCIVCVQFLWLNNVFYTAHLTASNWHGSHSLYFLSFCFIMMNVSKLGCTLDLFTVLYQVSDSFLLTQAGLYMSSSSKTGCQCHSSLKEKSFMVTSLSPGNAVLYLWSRELSLSCHGQPRGIWIVHYTNSYWYPNDIIEDIVAGQCSCSVWYLSVNLMFKFHFICCVPFGSRSWTLHDRTSQDLLIQLDKTSEQLWVGYGEYYKISTCVIFLCFEQANQAEYLTAF